jgi:hypothetical protein
VGGTVRRVSHGGGAALGLGRHYDITIALAHTSILLSFDMRSSRPTFR